MFTVFYYTRLHLSNFNGSWNVTVKQNINFNIYLPSRLYFCFFFTKIMLKVMYYLEMYLHTKVMVPHWVVQLFHTPQKIECCNFWMVTATGLRKYGVEVTFKGMTSLLNFINTSWFVKNYYGEHTDRMVIS